MYTITKATIGDIPAVNNLVNKAYRGDTSRKGWTTEADLLDGLRINEDILTLYVNDPDTTVLKCEKEGVMEGCVYLKKEGAGLYLGMLTVDPQLQNAGLGKMLLQEAENYARTHSLGFIMMTVLSARHELIAYYERRGYVKTGEVQPFHTDTAFGIPKQHLELLVFKKVLA